MNNAPVCKTCQTPLNPHSEKKMSPTAVYEYEGEIYCETHYPGRSDMEQILDP